MLNAFVTFMETYLPSKWHIWSRKFVISILKELNCDIQTSIRFHFDFILIECQFSLYLILLIIYFNKKTNLFFQFSCARFQSFHALQRTSSAQPQCSIVQLFDSFLHKQWRYKMSEIGITIMFGYLTNITSCPKFNVLEEIKNVIFLKNKYENSIRILRFIELLHFYENKRDWILPGEHVPHLHAFFLLRVAADLMNLTFY